MEDSPLNQRRQRENEHLQGIGASNAGQPQPLPTMTLSPRKHQKQKARSFPSLPHQYTPASHGMGHFNPPGLQRNEFPSPEHHPLHGWSPSRQEFMGPPQMGPFANVPNDSMKKTLNVESPAFTPATLSAPGKTSTISSQAANAAPFTPRGLASGKHALAIYPIARPQG
jgi:hypothetical protein